MAEPAPFLDKVTAFVTRRSPAGIDLLLFQHPTAGVQVPAGTVEDGEPLTAAVLRETAEETGLKPSRIVAHIGWRDELPPSFTHVIYHSTKVYSHPDPNSSDWAFLRRGIAVRFERRQGDFVQVTYDEGDRYPNPNYLSYQITGWVPVTALAARNRRHFFHLEYNSSSPDRWEQFSDHHRFQLFWAPLNRLPPLIDTVQGWLDYVVRDLGYSFER